MIFFTSDTHFGHANIIKYCDRPFKDTDHMDQTIIDNWNSVVAPNDVVFHLGDVALGNIDKSLACVSRLNGYIICKLGNHDRPFMDMNKPAKYDTWMERYREVFDEVWTWHDTRTVSLNGQEFVVSHFPYTGDHTPTDRHSEHRPVDDGITPLIHGHTHISDQRLSLSSNGTAQIHVGQDAWNFTPVHEDEIMNLWVSGSND
jgi:calcineurin-like phosphoesterase family protein